MATKKENLEQSQKALAEFFNLAKYLLSDDAPYDINEIPEDNQYYGKARCMSDDMGLDWNNMEHEDSNRLILNLLSDHYCAIQTDEAYVPVLTISFKKAE